MNKNEKIRETLKARYPTYIKNCEYCDEEIKYRLKQKYLRGRFCSNSCRISWKNENDDLAKIAGRKSAKSQNKRSKNEMYFANLCKCYFNEVLMNEQIFNGWDADIIVNDIKVAVMWNGIWHYEKVTKKHSLKQVQNRDKIKIKEIKKAGYIPYIIKDMGKENNKFVEKKFMEFICKTQKFNVM